MAKPIIIVNCKTYPQATGKGAVQLAKYCERATQQHNVDIRIAVQATDIARVAKAVSIPVYAQHVDAVLPGQSTGWLTVQAIKEAGARGALLNHAEHRMQDALIADTVCVLRKEKLHAIVCAENIRRLHDVGKLPATLFCVEPPELIGGKISVSTAQPAMIKSAVGAVKQPLVVGAGIKNHDDFVTSLHLGAKGVLVASSVVLAKNQQKALRQLIVQ